MPKYAIKMCKIMKIGQTAVLCGLSDTQHTLSVQRHLPRANELLNLVVVC